MVADLTVCGNDDRIGALNKRVKQDDSFKVAFFIPRPSMYIEKTCTIW